MEKLLVNGQGWGEYYSGNRLAQNDQHEYTKNIVLEYNSGTDFRTLMFSTRPSPDKYRLKRKGKNKSREEIFYQMKGFFFFC